MRIGPQILGLRSDSGAILDALREVLGPSLADDVEPYPNITIQVGEHRGSGRPIPHVYRRGGLAVRATSIGHAVRASLGLLATFEPAVGHDRFRRPLRARAVFGPRGAVLVSEMFGPGLETRARRLGRDGLTLVPGAPVFVDPQTFEVVTPTPQFAYDEDALDRLEARYPRHQTELTFAERREEIRGVVIFSLCPPNPGPAELLAQLYSFALGNEQMADIGALELLAALQQRVPVRVLPDYDIDAMTAAVASLMAPD